MLDIQKLKRARADLVEEMRNLLASVETREGKQLTDDERSKLAKFQKDADNITADIARAEFLNKEESRDSEEPQDKRNAQENFGEFLTDVRQGNHSRLEARDVTMGDGPSAGFIVPDQFDQTIREIAPDQAVVRPRSLVMPAGTPPDAALNMVALDQGADRGVYSGVTVNWVDEVGTNQDAGDPKVKQIKLEPQQVSGYIDVSDKLLRNSAAAGAMVERMLRGAITGSEEDAFFNGDGVGKPLGILSSDACINVQRTTASNITYEDLVAMFPLTMGTNLAWVGNRTILPELMTMVATGTNTLAWQPSARDGAPSTLLGLPLLENPYSPVLGTRGDLALVDLNHYAIKDGSPLALFMDPFTQKLNNITRIYAFWNVDGQSMLYSSMLKPDGVTRVSPFVVLDDPA